jgi:hypothetical protein
LMWIAFGLVGAWLRALIPPFHGPMRRQAPSYVPDGPKTPTCVSRPQDLSQDDALLGPRRRQSTRRRSQSGRPRVGRHERAPGPPRAACMRPPAHPPAFFHPCALSAPRILALLRLSDVHLTCLPTLLPACLRPQAHGVPRRWQRGLTLDKDAHGGGDKRRIRWRPGRPVGHREASRRAARAHCSRHGGRCRGEGDAASGRRGGRQAARMPLRRRRPSVRPESRASSATSSFSCVCAMHHRDIDHVYVV